MPKMTFIERDGNRKVVDAPVGMSVMEIARKNDVDIEGACEGSLACSTCHVIVDADWVAKLTAASEEEEDMLDLADARHGGHGLGHLAGHGARHRAGRRRQRHVDGDVAIGRAVEAVDEAEIVEVHGNLGVVDGLDRVDDRLFSRRRRARGQRLPGIGQHVFPGGGCAGHEIGQGAVVAHSVFTGSPAPSSAAFIVCHAKVAHFTRIG